MAYAGDLRPTEAWELLKAEQAAQLVDVRTRPEWSFVGIPDLGSIGKKPILLAWQAYPAMQINPTFAEDLRRTVSSPETPLLFICRSGTRSRAAAETMTAAGYRRCYNVAEGFEGQVDAEGHRGREAGWKAAGLPWNQD
jgi:rhodanese-related sulfurtransferase